MRINPTLEWLFATTRASSLSQQFPQAFQVVEIEALVAIRALELGFDISIACDVLEGDSILIHEGLI